MKCVYFLFIFVVVVVVYFLFFIFSVPRGLLRENEVQPCVTEFVLDGSRF